jgi:hypothetical protein
VARALGAALGLAVLGIILAGPPVSADCGGTAFARDLPADLTAFAGTFEGVRRETDATGTRMDPFYHWRVDRTWAGPELTREYRFDGGSCHPLKFSEGARYLIAFPAHPQNIDAFSTVAWLLPGNGEARLVGFEVPALEYPTRFQVSSVAEAIALISDRALPPTDSKALVETASVPTAMWSLAMGVLPVGVWLSLRLRSRRHHLTR